MEEQHSDHQIVCKPIGRAQRGMERRFPGVGPGCVDVSALFNEKLTETPVSVKHRTVEVQIVTKRL